MAVNINLGKILFEATNRTAEEVSRQATEDAQVREALKNLDVDAHAIPVVEFK